MSNAMHPVEGNAPSTFSNPEELHRVLFEQATDGIFIADPQLRFLAVNPRGSELIGYSSEELRGMRITDLIPAEDLVADPLRVDDLRQGRIVTRERRFHRKDGALLTIEVSTRMLAGGNLLGIVRDITERKRAEEALQSSLEEKESLLKEVHHRVKNTLQVISSLLNLQARRVTNLEVRAFLRDTQNRVGSMAMLHEILYHSGNLARIRFPDYVKSLCALLGRSYGVRPEGDHRLQLRVADDGAGIPADRELQSEETLGLRLVHNLVRQLDGRMTISSDPGAVFQIVLPLRPAEGSSA
jgi:PAS domain S-box-containing protein